MYVFRMRKSLYGLFLALFVSSAPTHAQPPSTRLNLAKKQIILTVKGQSLPAIAALLSQQTGCNILIDDEPLLKGADFNFQGTLGDALDAVADRFDYLWQQNRQGVILMRKRFRDPGELPQMNLPEMREMAKQIVEVLRIVPFDLNAPPCENSWDELCKTLMQALTPAQRAYANAGNILHLSDLRPNQAALLQRIVVNHRFEEMIPGWNTLLEQLQQLPYSRLTVQQKLPLSPQEGTAPYLEFALIGRGLNGQEGYLRLKQVPLEKERADR